MQQLPAAAVSSSAVPGQAAGCAGQARRILARAARSSSSSQFLQHQLGDSYCPDCSLIAASVQGGGCLLAMQDRPFGGWRRSQRLACLPLVLISREGDLEVLGSSATWPVCDGVWRRLLICWGGFTSWCACWALAVTPALAEQACMQPWRGAAAVQPATAEWLTCGRAHLDVTSGVPCDGLDLPAMQAGQAHDLRPIQQAGDFPFAPASITLGNGCVAPKRLDRTAYPVRLPSELPLPLPLPRQKVGPCSFGALRLSLRCLVAAKAGWQSSLLLDAAAAGSLRVQAEPPAARCTAEAWTPHCRVCSTAEATAALAGTQVHTAAWSEGLSGLLCR